MMRIGYECGGHLGEFIIEKLLSIRFPNEKIEVVDNGDCDIVIKSHFNGFKCWVKNKKPYIYWSGESHSVKEKINHTNYIELVSYIENTEFSYYVPFCIFGLYHRIYVDNIYNFRRIFTNIDRKYDVAYCCSNHVGIREKIFISLAEKLKECHSLGNCNGGLHNTRRKIDENNIDKCWSSVKLIEKYSEYNFVIAMENRMHPGYVTEKIANAFLSGAIPIYYGDNIIKDFFNENAFIYVPDFTTLEDCANKISNMTKNDIHDMMQQPIFNIKNGKINEMIDLDSEYYRNISTKIPTN